MVRSRLLSALLVSIFVASATAAPAAVHFAIPAGDAQQTLRLFLMTSRIEMLYRLDKIRGVKTNAVNGDFTPHRALEMMLAGTTLGARFNQDDSFATVEPIATATR
jgi:iron complex outermembrane recepter protein